MATDSADVILMDGTLKNLVQIFNTAREFKHNMNLISAGIFVPCLINLGGAFLFQLTLLPSMILSGISVMAGFGSAMWPLVRYQQNLSVLRIWLLYFPSGWIRTQNNDNIGYPTFIPRSYARMILVPVRLSTPLNLCLVKTVFPQIQDEVRQFVVGSGSIFNINGTMINVFIMTGMVAAMLNIEISFFSLLLSLPIIIMIGYGVS